MMCPNCNSEVIINKENITKLEYWLDFRLRLNFDTISYDYCICPICRRKLIHCPSDNCQALIAVPEYLYYDISESPSGSGPFIYDVIDGEIKVKTPSEKPILVESSCKCCSFNLSETLKNDEQIIIDFLEKSPSELYREEAANALGAIGVRLLKSRKSVYALALRLENEPVDEVRSSCAQALYSENAASYCLYDNKILNFLSRIASDKNQDDMVRFCSFGTLTTMLNIDHLESYLNSYLSIIFTLFENLYEDSKFCRHIDNSLKNFLNNSRNIGLYARPILDALETVDFSHLLPDIMRYVRRFFEDDTYVLENLTSYITPFSFGRPELELVTEQRLVLKFYRTVLAKILVHIASENKFLASIGGHTEKFSDYTDIVDQAGKFL